MSFADNRETYLRIMFLASFVTIACFAGVAESDDFVYPYVTAEPRKTGWPLTEDERTYVVEKTEHDRRPGREANKHLPKLWPLVPTAGHFGGDAWLKLPEAHGKTVLANQGFVGPLLVGDSITIQWGEARRYKPEAPASETTGTGRVSNLVRRVQAIRQVASETQRNRSDATTENRTQDLTPAKPLQQRD